MTRSSSESHAPLAVGLRPTPADPSARRRESRRRPPARQFARRATDPTDSTHARAPRRSMWLRRALSIALVIGSMMPSLVTAAAAETVIATTDTGPVEGVVTPAMDEFLGIPYAAAPVGELRWMPPQPHAAWSSPLDTSAYGNHCPQITSPFGLASTTEDCLFLNVYTPHRKSVAARDLRRNRPVMVWIHGGAFQVGESDEYDPTRLVEVGDVVVVTINYRLGALGFLAHPALSAESPDGVSGNYGILDQQFALQWVQRNIRAFGGNPRRVTIFGESAGGISVHAQLASPLAAGLFQRAIVESGGVFLQPTLAAAETSGGTLADAVGCSDQSAACLRAVSVDQLLANQGTELTSSSPVIDGHVLPQPMLTAFKNGDFNRVPVIEGSNHDEMRLFVALLIELVDGPLSDEDYPDAVASFLGVPPSLVPALISHYPLANYDSAGLALSALATDASFACSGFAATRALSGKVRTYGYEFDDENAPELFLPPVSYPYGAAHASEIQYLFDVPNVVAAPPLDAGQQQLSDAMVRYWTRFARTGKPTPPHVPRWPRYDGHETRTQQLLSLAAPSPVVESGLNFSLDHQCAFWDSLLGN